MSILMDKDEYVPFAPETEGTIHKHHCKGGRGNDRLYITRCKDGTILAYCHHCSARGYHSVASERTVRSRAEDHLPSERASDGTAGGESTDRSSTGGHKGSTKDRLTGRLEHYRDTSRILGPPFREWPIPVKKWWLEYGLTIPEVDIYTVLYVPEEECLDMLITKGGEVVGLHSRNFNSSVPKYLSAGDLAARPYTRAVGRPNACVIVEDMRSAFKCAKFIDALPLLGTSLRKGHTGELLKKGYGKILIWLDNDSLFVKRKAHDIFKQLTPYFRCEIIKIEQDPKEVSFSKLEELFNDHAR